MMVAFGHRSNPTYQKSIPCTKRGIGREMEAYEATRIVFSRIQSLEPENVSKIIGYLLLHDLAEEEMIRLAFGPNAVLQSIISKAKRDLGLSDSAFSSSQQSIHLLSPHLSDHLSLQYSQLSHPPEWGSIQMPLSAYGPLGVPENLHVRDDHNYGYLNLSRQALPDQIDSNTKFSCYQDQVGLSDHEFPLQEQIFPISDFPESRNSYSLPSDSIYEVFSGSSHRRSSSMSDAIPATSESLSWKPCVYFARGYCKHGSNCRFSHGCSRSENMVPLLPSYSSSESHIECGGGAVSLGRLEREVQELLRGKRAPLSIAALPQIYYERFGKTLQAEGYLTESQRHGKIGYSLTNLLARLKNTVTLIDRPHGQHAIVLAEDAHRFTGFRNERDDLGGVNPGSRQIYMTFPAESTFTEEDVSNYFGIYGPVHDVRIPYQQKRMFGFVTYVFPETVKIILAKGNPHYVCGARVLVKPYREKTKKYPGRGEHSRYLPAYGVDPKEYDSNLGTTGKHRSDDQEQAIELEMLRFAELCLGDMNRRHTENQATMVAQMHQNHFSNVLVDDVEEAAKDAEDLNSFSSADPFSFLGDVLDGEGNGEAESKHNLNPEEECNGHNLPESPFAISLGSGGIETLTHPENSKNLTVSKNSAPDADITKELSCSIGLDSVVDEVQLDCKHAFCINCTPKGIAVCPNRGQQSTDVHIPSAGRVPAAANIW